MAKKCMSCGGSMGKKPKMNVGGPLKEVPAGKEKSLGQLPAPVRNRMGYAKKGGTVKKKK